MFKLSFPQLVSTEIYAQHKYFDSHTCSLFKTWTAPVKARLLFQSASLDQYYMRNAQQDNSPDFVTVVMKNVKYVLANMYTKMCTNVHVLHAIFISTPFCSYVQGHTIIYTITHRLLSPVQALTTINKYPKKKSYDKSIST